MLFPGSSHYTGLLLLAAGCFAVFSACGVSSRTAPPSDSRPGASPSETSRSLSNVQSELYRVHEEWKGTPYVLGGSSASGVDCSSFIQIVFDRHFDIRLPRVTRQQIEEGRGIRRNSARPGDLVFFRTTRRDLHVGIIIEEDQFLHASVSSGVMISSLRERYWAVRFLGVRRVM